MIKTRLIHGIVPVVLTPFTKDGEIDVFGLQDLVRFLVSQEIGGLWVLGTGSEDMNLSFEKRLQVAKVVTEVNNNKIPLVLGASFFAMEDILRFMEETKEFNTDGYHVMPYHPLLSLDRLEWFYKHIADYCPSPLWMYCSGNWSNPLTPEFVARLKEYNNIAGIKYSNVNAVLESKIISIADDNFQVITAVANQLYPCLCMGSRAHTSSLASCLPEQMIKIYKLFSENRHAEALKQQRLLSDFLSRLAQNTKSDNFIQAADEKYILSRRGICDEYVSSYYRESSEDEKNNINALLNEFSFF